MEQTNPKVDGPKDDLGKTHEREAPRPRGWTWMRIKAVLRSDKAIVSGWCVILGYVAQGVTNWRGVPYLAMFFGFVLSFASAIRLARKYGMWRWVVAVGASLIVSTLISLFCIPQSPKLVRWVPPELAPEDTVVYVRLGDSEGRFYEYPFPIDQLKEHPMAFFDTHAPVNVRVRVVENRALVDATFLSYGMEVPFRDSCLNQLPHPAFKLNIKSNGLAKGIELVSPPPDRNICCQIIYEEGSGNRIRLMGTLRGTNGLTYTFGESVPINASRPKNAEGIYLTPLWEHQ